MPTWLQGIVSVRKLATEDSGQRGPKAEKVARAVDGKLENHPSDELWGSG